MHKCNDSLYNIRVFHIPIMTQFEHGEFYDEFLHVEIDVTRGVGIYLFFVYAER